MPYLNHLNNLDSGKIPGMMLWMSIPTAHHAHDIVRVSCHWIIRVVSQSIDWFWWLVNTMPDRFPSNLAMRPHGKSPI